MKKSLSHSRAGQATGRPGIENTLKLFHVHILAVLLSTDETEREVSEETNVKETLFSLGLGILSHSTTLPHLQAPLIATATEQHIEK